MQLDTNLKVAITGANGQLGFQLVKNLSGKVKLKAFDRASLDIANSFEVEKKLTAFTPDIIINAAAYTAVDKAEQEIEQADAINHFGAKYLAQTAEKLNAILIHVSTDYVFNGESDTPYLETDKTNPQSIYGKTKLAGELAVIEHCSKHIILRTAWVFAEHGNNFVKTMLRLAQSQPELRVVADQTGGPTYAGDIADAIISICVQLKNTEESRWGIYHFSGMPFVSWHQFAVAIFKQAESLKLINKIPVTNAITTADYQTPAKRPAYSMLNCDKIDKQFAIKSSNWAKALENLTLYK
ncbi:dTDP-4-dehydrorhamnose reductase [Alishewanella sp. 16-MA]|uniref:dTDP-4-dehydrorhamnose reductase n=1 Tax=Alishewanella maricola TaxID=2795740 RepID=A0ABS8C168_9ALTE|nr:dTDP-4-dehydrorhamnose reductase [Alishewanella maricola]MCB5226072.1 dTDP-4-dehydrorhamnose reductase [Alishewanella maricola]